MNVCVIWGKNQLTEDRRYISQEIAIVNTGYYSEMSLDNCLFRAEEDRRGKIILGLSGNMVHSCIRTSIHERKTDRAECKWKQPDKGFGNWC